jgi:O-antigen/teichoic acid export membrane protein
MFRPRTLILNALQIPFIRNLSYSFVSGGVFGVANILFFVLWGRRLGPEGFGLLSMFFFSLPFLATLIARGEDIAFIRSAGQIPEAKKEEYQKGLRKRVSRGGVFFLAFFFALYEVLLVILGPEHFIFDQKALWFCIPIASFALLLKNFTDALLRASGLFAWQMIGRIGESLLLLLPFFFFWSGGIYVAVLSLPLSYLFFTGFAFWARRYAAPTIQTSSEFLTKDFKTESVRFGYYSLLGSFGAFLLTAVDKFLLGSQLGLEQAGVYSAYYIVTVAPLILLQTVILNVFFPWANKQENKVVVLKRLTRYLHFFAPGALLATFLAGSSLFFFFGSSYEYNWQLMLLFCCYAYLFFAFNMRQWLLASRGSSGILVSSVIALSFSGALILVMFFGGTLTTILFGMNVVALLTFFISGRQKHYY